MDGQKANSSIHFLPCTIEFDGPAPVKNFFPVSEIRVRGESKLKAHFRGRKLLGEKVTLPVGVQGLCVHSKPSADSSCSWTVSGNFNELNVWEHDKTPDLGFFQDTMEWFEVSDAVSKYLLIYKFE